jgi:hypothetical protein
VWLFSLHPRGPITCGLERQDVRSGCAHLQCTAQQRSAPGPRPAGWCSPAPRGAPGPAGRCPRALPWSWRQSWRPHSGTFRQHTHGPGTPCMPLFKLHRTAAAQKATPSDSQPAPSPAKPAAGIEAASAGAMTTIKCNGRCKKSTFIGFMGNVRGDERRQTVWAPRAQPHTLIRRLHLSPPAVLCCHRRQELGLQQPGQPHHQRHLDEHLHARRPASADC